jgi:hypothetical protein
MMTWLIGLALSAGVPQKAAKPVVFGMLALALAAALWGGWALLKHNIISNHEAKQVASNAKADRKADDQAAVQRRTDDARLTQEAGQLKEAQKNARTDTDRRLARARCIRLQQAARRDGKQPPSCLGPDVSGGAASAD